MKDKVLFFRESLLQSVLADVFSFSMMCGSIWFNYKFIGGSYFLNAIILIMLMTFSYSRVRGMQQVFTSKEELLKYISNI